MDGFCFKRMSCRGCFFFGSPWSSGYNKDSESESCHRYTERCTSHGGEASRVPGDNDTAMIDAEPWEEIHLHVLSGWFNLSYLTVFDRVLFGAPGRV